MPHSYATGCRCPECFTLAEVVQERTGSDFGLASAPRRHIRLHVVTDGPEVCHGYANCCRCTDCRIRAGEIDHAKQPEPVECDGSMTCRCSACMRERRRRIVEHRPDVRQPWEVAAA